MVGNSVKSSWETFQNFFLNFFNASTENDFPALSTITSTEMENEFNCGQCYDAAAHDADQSSVSMQLDVKFFDSIDSY